MKRVSSLERTRCVCETQMPPIMANSDESQVERKFCLISNTHAKLESPYIKFTIMANLSF